MRAPWVRGAAARELGKEGAAPTWMEGWGLAFE